MKIIGNCLYLEISDAEQCGLGNANYIYKEKSRGAKWGVFIKDPQYENKVLIEYDTLAPAKKELVDRFFGNPYERLAKQPIRNMVTKDTVAEKFFFDYRYDNKNLPIDTINSYTTAASWLNMLKKAEEDKKHIKKMLGLSLADFWIKVAEIIEADKINLPTSYKRLRQKIADYTEKGYEVLIHGQFGNDHRAKIDDEVCEAVLVEMISMPNQTDEMTARRYNLWAAANNKQQITEKTVWNWRKKFAAVVSVQKLGTKKTYNTFGKYIQRARPSAPLLLVEHDDNEVDLYFQSTEYKNGRKQVNYFNRFVIALVLDPFNDYVLGWSIGKEYNKELIHRAYLDAVHHIKEITGDFFLPHQIRCDRFGLDAKGNNDLGLFYKSLATFTPAAPRAARGKYIERFFGSDFAKVISIQPNYAGRNVTAKTKLNEDFVEANKRTYPDVSEAPKQIAAAINMMRLLVDEATGMSKQEQWLKAFNESERSKQHHISEVQMLHKLGFAHTHTNKITNRGITPAINCVERTYEVPEEHYMHTIGKEMQVIYDPFDFSRILLTDNASTFFIARQQELMPSALADFKPGDRTRLNDRLDEKARHMQGLVDKIEQRKGTLQRNRIDVESYLQAGVHTKAINHDMLAGYIPETTTAAKPKKQKQLPERTINDVINDI